MDSAGKQWRLSVPLSGVGGGGDGRPAAGNEVAPIPGGQQICVLHRTDMDPGPRPLPHKKTIHCGGFLISEEHMPIIWKHMK